VIISELTSHKSCLKQDDPILVDDKKAMEFEAHVTSDIAEGWDPSCKTKQTENSPDDADFGAVMSMGNVTGDNDPNEHVADVLDAIKKAKTDKSVTIELGDKPLNEFSEFSKILSGAFPAEFPLGVTDEQLGGSGPMKKSTLTRLLKFYDGRIAKNPVLLLWLADMRIRHKSVATTTAYVKKQSREKLVAYMNGDEFDRLVSIAEQDRSSDEAKQLVRRIGPLIRLAGSKVPWGPLERLSATVHVYALYHTFGPASFFITFAPKTLTNKLVLKFGLMQSAGNPNPCDLNLPLVEVLKRQIKKAQIISEVELSMPENLQRRVELLASNTIAQARAYSLIIKMVAELLFGIPCVHTVKKTRKPVVGLFGLSHAFYGVHEVQARNALHAHIVLWVKSLDPKLIRKHVHRPEIREAFVKIIDSVVTASTQDFEHVYDKREERVPASIPAAPKLDPVKLKVEGIYFRLLKSGEKTVESRPYYKYLRHYGIGDLIKFINRDDVTDSFTVRISYKETYDDFGQMLQNETVEACLPTVNGDFNVAKNTYNGFRGGQYESLAAENRVVAYKFETVHSNAKCYPTLVASMVFSYATLTLTLTLTLTPQCQMLSHIHGCDSVPQCQMLSHFHNTDA